MAIFDLADGVHLFGYIAAFWTFLISPTFRARQIREFRKAGLGGRCVLLLKGSIATACGLFPIGLIGWLVRPGPA